MVGIMFIASSYFSLRHSDYLKEVIEFKGLAGVAVFVFLEGILIVVVPVTTIPLFPIAVVLWGGFLAAVLNVIGWMIGAAIAFSLARKYGKPFVSRFIKSKYLIHLERLIPEKNIFWSIVILRMSIPTDILSYALGLFTNIPMNIYLLATFFGLIPFAFIFAYSVNLSVWHQIAALALSASLIYYGYNKSNKKL